MACRPSGKGWICCQPVHARTTGVELPLDMASQLAYCKEAITTGTTMVSAPVARVDDLGSTGHLQWMEPRDTVALFFLIERSIIVFPQF